MNADSSLYVNLHKGEQTISNYSSVECILSDHLQKMDLKHISQKIMLTLGKPYINERNQNFLYCFTNHTVVIFLHCS